VTDAGYERSTRAAYDEVADDYTRLLNDSLANSPMDRAVLQLFAESVTSNGCGRVADVGCGPGRITAHLHDLGLDVFGIDLSPAMINVARHDHPDLRFDEGSMTALDIEDEELAGVVAWYSVIHTPPDDHPHIYAELSRVLKPEGRLVVAFQVGDQKVHLEQAYGHTVSLDVFRLAPDRVTDQLEAAGFDITARIVREAIEPEKQQQAYLLARKRAA
jgi:ubiquinone/menaquinone biosynthesis C-methylase UbiE